MSLAAMGAVTVAALVVLAPIAGSAAEWPNAVAVPATVSTPMDRRSKHSMMALSGNHAVTGMINTGNVDDDFAGSMRSNHAMAIRLAQAQIDNGHDPQMLRLAQEIIDAQQAEVTEIDRWLAANRAFKHPLAAKSD